MHGVVLRSPMLIFLPHYVLPWEVRSLHRHLLSIKAPRAARCPLSIQEPKAARSPRVQGFFPGSWRPLSQCMSLVTPSQTHSVGLVCRLWQPPLRLRHHIQMRDIPRCCWGGAGLCQGGSRASRQRDIPVSSGLEVCHGYDGRFSPIQLPPYPRIASNAGASPLGGVVSTTGSRGIASPGQGAPSFAPIPSWPPSNEGHALPAGLGNVAAANVVEAVLDLA